MIYDIDVVRLVKQIKTKEYITEHIHENLYHYIFVLSGDGKVTINGETYSPTEKTLLMIAPKTPHAVYGINEFCAIDIKFRAEGYLNGLCQFDNPVCKLNNYETALITDMLDNAIMRTYNANNIINAKMLELLMLIHQKQKKEEYIIIEDSAPDALGSPGEVTGNAKLEKVRNALDYIEKNLDKPLSVTKLSEISGYSSTHFSQMFKDAMGVSPKRYINYRKIRYAKILLLSSRMNITQISDLLGYESIHYFSRIFKHVTGKSPSEYYESANSDMGINLLEGYVKVADDGFEFEKKSVDSNTKIPGTTLK